MNSTIAHRQTIFRPWSRVKRPATPLVAVSMAVWLGFAVFAGGVTPGAAMFEEKVEAFSPEEYERAVERLFAVFEEARGEAVRPGEKGKVGLKVYTGSGAGLATPLAMVRAVVGQLLERGFTEEDIFLVDQSASRLRQAGFLPSLADGGVTFEGHPVKVLETGDFYDDRWFYDSPLPPRREAARASHRRGEFSYEQTAAGRRSLLPKPLLLEVDFWINLPVYTDHPVLGINGALTNATLWNASNTARFFQSRQSGAAAVAEMAAVPELADGWLFSLVSLERYQFVGGPTFHSLYTASEPVLMLSADPVALDSLMYRKINERRVERNFEPLEEGLALLDYARQLNLGRPGALAPPNRLRGENERDSLGR